MAVREVICRRALAAPPDAVWTVVSDFASDWHPAIATCMAAAGPDGAEERRFIGTDGRIYRERLTYLSHSDRVLRYSLVEGIAGVRSYAGKVRVGAEGAGSRIVWQARIDAPADRLDAIAEGTAAIFEAGLDWLAHGDLPSGAVPEEPPPAPAPLTRRLCEAGPRLSWLRGDARGDTLVVFLHGIGGNARNWAAQLAAFGGRYPVAALDLRGYGDSALGPRQTALEDHYDDILRVMRAEGARRVVLAGLSMGAWIATGFALRHPSMLAGLVIAGGCTGMSEAAPAERAAFLAAREKPLAEGQTPADFAPAVVDVIAGPGADAATRAALQGSMAAIPAATYRDALTCFCNPPARFDFAKLACPVLAMTGAHDRLAPPDEIRAVSHRLHAAMARPDIRLEVIGNAGHVCNLEAGAVFDRHLSAFLARCA